MKDFEELKALWSNQVERTRFSPEDILKTIRRSRSQFAKRLLSEVFAMTAAILILISAWAVLDFRMWTSHMALLIFIACCLYVMFVQYRDYRRMKDETLLTGKPEEYIRYLKAYKKGRHNLNTRKYKAYTLLFSAGLASLFVEIFFLASLWVTIIGVLFTMAWFLVCYFIFMKSYIRREEGKLNEMIENLERLQEQFRDKEH
jgi:1,4-dihydroxy-2-naphthoate octaprenyltransferase